MDSNPIHHPSPANKMKCFFLDYVHFWWSARVVDGLNPICHQSPPKIMKCSFLDYIQLLMIDGLVDGLKPHPPPVSSQKNEILIFVLHWTSDDQPGWSMDSTPSTNLSTQKNEMLIFGLCSTSDDQPGLLDGLEPCPPPISSQKMKCSYFDYVLLLMIGRAGRWTQTPSTTPLQPKNEMLIFDCVHFWWSAGLLMNLNPICHSSTAKKMKCWFFDYVQLLMISMAGQWTQSPSATPLQPIKWNAHFWITFNFWWSAGLVDGLEPHPPPVSSQ